QVYGTRRNQQLIEIVIRGRRLSGKITLHGGERNKDFVHIPTVVAGVLLFFLHDSDDDIGEIVQVDGLSDGIAFGKQLFGCIGSETRNAAWARHVAFVVGTDSTRLQGAHRA